MGSLTPPWADELLARNTKIARKMMSSLSTESYFEPDQQLSNGTLPSSQDLTTGTPVPMPTTGKNASGRNKVVDLAGSPTATMASSQSPNSSSTTSCSSSSNRTSQVNRQQYGRNTEKLSPIRNERDSMFDEDPDENTKSFAMTNGGEDLSILEYGPGIVKKLRSRYQSLALRQFSARPTLRRSASLENCLEAVSADDLAASLESKISGGSSALVQPSETNDEADGRQRGRKLTSPTDSVSGSPAGTPTQHQNGSLAKPVGGPRGRSSGTDASARRDRMRRARSVDALHRTKREEEILEKFKHVVLPKEEIVIIEVPKPQPGTVSPANVFNQGSAIITGNGVDKRYPTRLLLTSNNLRNSAVLDQQTANRVRSLISPEHELPPHDIVRETARIFEKNQENLNRRIGQALRLSKSTTSVVSPTSSTSPPLTPTSPTPSTTNISQQKTVMAQSATTQLPSSMQPQDKSFPTKTRSKVEANNSAQTNGMANGPPHGQKQIGIIKPTLSNSAIVSSKIANGETKSDRVRSPILSPIGFPSQNHKPLIQNSQKPPLSPKPIFTSSPKVNGPLSGAGAAATPNNIFPKSTLTRESLASSPILIIEKDRSISPFKSESPIPRVNHTSAQSKAETIETARPKSPVSSRSPSGDERHDAFMRSSSPVSGKLSPVEADHIVKRLGNNIVRSSSPTGVPAKLEDVKSKPVVTNSTVLNGQSKEPSSDHLNNIPAVPNRSSSPSKGTVDNKASQLRVHQKQKSSQGSNGSMVFNFTSRQQVPDYIEDDGLRRSSRGNEAVEDGSMSTDPDLVDSKLIVPVFEGGNVIINGRSSIQRKPKSRKLNISFNEEATMTYEYPSESSFVIEEEPSESEAGNKKPNVISGSSLGSYTPKVGSNTYQLGAYTVNRMSDGSSGHKKPNSKEDENEFIEDYLKPNLESTTWSNEMSADILF